VEAWVTPDQPRFRKVTITAKTETVEDYKNDWMKDIGRNSEDSRKKAAPWPVERNPVMIGGLLGGRRKWGFARQRRGNSGPAARAMNDAHSRQARSRLGACAAS
jgi:hypothetical protein